MGARERPWRPDALRPSVPASRRDRNSAKRGRREHEGQRRAADAAGDRARRDRSHSHLTEPVGRLRRSSTPDGAALRGRDRASGRPPRRGRRAAVRRARPARGRDARHDARAVLASRPHPARASTRSSRPASPVSSSASTIPTRMCGRGHRPAAGRGHRGRRRRRRGRGARPARALPEAPPHRPAVRRAEARRHARRPHRRARRHEPVDHREPRPGADAHRLRAESDAVIVGRRHGARPTTRRSPCDDVRRSRSAAGRARARARRAPRSSPALELQGDARRRARRARSARRRAGDGRGRRDRRGARSTAPGLVDRYVLYLAPALFGGDDGRPLFAGPGAPTIDDVWRGRLDLGRSPRRRLSDSSWSQPDVHRHRRGARARVALATAPGSASARAPCSTASQIGDSTSVNGCCLTVVDARRRLVGGRRHRRDARPHQPRRPARPATPSTSSGRCGSRIGSAATSCRATSTGSARSSKPAPDLRVTAPAGAAALRRREGLDHRRRRQPDGRRTDSPTASPSPSSPTPPRSRPSGTRAPATRVNLEVDVMAKYVERLLDAPQSTRPRRRRSDATATQTARTES